MSSGTATRPPGRGAWRGARGPRTVAPAPPEDSIGRIPRDARVYNREAYLVERARDRSVIHLGFVDVKNMRGKYDEGAWLHAQLSEATGRLVGVDNSETGVALARELGYEAYAADCQSTESVAAAQIPVADLVIAGEIIEHLERAGQFLDATRQMLAPDGELIITTPNPYALTNLLLGLIGREVQNDDHVGWHSWRTLDTLLGRHGYETVHVAYYRHPRFRVGRDAPIRARVRCAAFNLYQVASVPVLAAAPALGDGLIVHARVRSGRPSQAP